MFLLKPIFRNGYYITLENDTVYGLIDYRGEVRNSQTCVFKMSEVAEPEKFDPSEIQAYRFTDGKFYISKQINTVVIKKKLFPLNFWLTVSPTCNSFATLITTRILLKIRMVNY